MTTTPPVHAPQTLFPVVDDCLQVGGIALPRLAERVGGTPFYAYDRRLITERVQKLLQIAGAWDEFKGNAPASPPAAPAEEPAADGMPEAAEAAS